MQNRYVAVITFALGCMLGAGTIAVAQSAERPDRFRMAVPQTETGDPIRVTVPEAKPLTVAGDALAVRVTGRHGDTAV